MASKLQGLRSKAQGQAATREQNRSESSNPNVVTLTGTVNINHNGNTQRAKDGLLGQVERTYQVGDETVLLHLAFRRGQAEPDELRFQEQLGQGSRHSGTATIVFNKELDLNLQDIISALEKGEDPHDILGEDITALEVNKREGKNDADFFIGVKYRPRPQNWKGKWDPETRGALANAEVTQTIVGDEGTTVTKTLRQEFPYRDRPDTAASTQPTATEETSQEEVPF